MIFLTVAPYESMGMATPGRRGRAEPYGRTHLWRTSRHADTRSATPGTHGRTVPPHNAGGEPLSLTLAGTPTRTCAPAYEVPNG